MSLNHSESPLWLKRAGKICLTIFIVSFAISIVAVVLDNSDRIFTAFVDELIDMVIIISSLIYLAFLLILIVFKLIENRFKPDFYYRRTLLNSETLFHAANKLSSSYNGFGIKLFGFTRHNENTFTATKWLSLLHLPVIPLSRMQYKILQEKNSIFKSITMYEILEQLPLSKKENRRERSIYPLFLAPFFSFTGLAMFIIHKTGLPELYGNWATALVILWIFAFIIGWEIRRSRQQSVIENKNS